jgi:Fe-S-cluster formation regulator IscX/YfhJ
MKPTDYTTILSKLTNEFPTVNPTLIDETLHEAVSTLLERKHTKMEPDNE